MRDFSMVVVAQQMNDLYDELVQVHEFNSTGAANLVVAYFTGGHTK